LQHGQGVGRQNIAGRLHAGCLNGEIV
jgi:hypothetical protein